MENAAAVSEESKGILYCGIDPSVNSSGLVVRYVESNGECSYQKMYQITPWSVKCSATAHNVVYNKRDTNTKHYTNDDLNKVVNGKTLGMTIVKIIKESIEFTGAEKVLGRMEGSVMSFGFKGSMARVNDLITYNTMIKFCLINSMLLDELRIVAPAQLKKAFTGNGRAKKEAVIEKFAELVPLFDFSIGKVDDIADAFGLAYIP